MSFVFANMMCTEAGDYSPKGGKQYNGIAGNYFRNILLMASDRFCTCNFS